MFVHTATLSCPDRGSLGDAGAGEAWGEKAATAREAAGLGGAPPSIGYLEVHSILTG